MAGAAAARRSRRSDSGGETVSETCEVRESSETWERESLGTSAITAVHWHHSSQTQLLVLTVVLYRLDTRAQLFQSISTKSQFSSLRSGFSAGGSGIRFREPRLPPAPSRRLTKFNVTPVCLVRWKKGESDTLRSAQQAQAGNAASLHPRERGPTPSAARSRRSRSRYVTRARCIPHPTRGTV